MSNEIPDRVAEIFNGTTIFLTGATGLVGKALIEKLLKLCEVKKLYVLIREKKGKSPSERMKDIFSNPLFRILLDRKPDAIKKCVPIVGDVSQNNLGISKENRKMLTEEVDFIFHSAATVRFDDSLKYAVTVNTRGTKFMLDLAEECTKLKLFVQVSTAYAFPNNKDGITYEQEYPPPANPHEVLSSINWLDEEALTPDLTKRLLGDIPNTYTFSKALSESLVYEKVGKIPLIICRPAIIIPAFKDPIPGWTNNLQGPAGLFVGAGKGVIRSVYMDSNSYANFVPIDSTVSALMVFAWYHLTSKDPKYIFNLCMPQSDLQVTWEEVFELSKDIIYHDAPFNLILWYPDGAVTKSKLYHKINTFLFQLIPAILIDLILLIVGQKPQFLAIQTRILKGMEMYEFYTTKRWDFETTNLEKIRKTMNDTEKENYQLDSEVKDVRKFLVDCILYLRRTFFKETDDMLPAARRNMKLIVCTIFTILCSLNKCVLSLLSFKTENEDNGLYFMTENGETNKFQLIYCLIVHVFLVFPPNVLQTVHLFTLERNVVTITASGYVVIMTWMSTCVFCFLFKNRQLLYSLMTDLNKDVFLLQNQASTAMVQKTYRFYNKVKIVLLVLCSIAVFSCMTTPLLHGREKMPTSSWYPFNITVSPIYQIVYIQQCLFLIYASAANIYMDIMVIAFTTFIGLQCDLLCYNMERKKNIKSIAMYISHHRSILNFSKRTEAVISEIYLFKFSASTLTLCMTLLLLSVKEKNSFEYFYFLMYYAAITCLLLVPCWCSSEMARKSQRIPFAAYSLPWQKAPNSLKRDIIFVIHSSQKFIIFQIMDMFPLSVETFVKIMKSSLSYYAVLSSLNMKEN